VDWPPYRYPSEPSLPELPPFLRRFFENIPRRRNVFVSFHHGTTAKRGDVGWANYLQLRFGEELDLFVDSSLPEPIDSTNDQYIGRRIHEEHIFGSSTTLVLVGC
jgi:hypothetical protein